MVEGDPREFDPANAFAPPLAVVVKGYPRLSETFVAQELKALESRGLAFDIWSLRKPYDPEPHPIHAEIAAEVRYLPEYLHQEPFRVLAGLFRAMRLKGFGRAFAQFVGDLTSDFSVNRVRRFGQACVLAAERPAPLDLLYAHFLHTPSSVAHYAALMRGALWGFSAHARDIWTTRASEKRGKIDAALFGFTCTRFGADHLNALGADRTVALAYHGLDLDALPRPPEQRPPRRGTVEADAVRFLSVGRTVAKKGYDHLLVSLADLPETLHWRFTHIGGGELQKSLREKAERLGVSQKIDWLGKRDRAAVIAAMRDADVFVLPVRIAEDGDRDGLPNVLLEAASQGLPIVTSRQPGPMEFVRHKQEGLLVRSGNILGLTRALDRLARDPKLRTAYGEAARRRVEARFRIDQGVDSIEAALRKGLREGAARRRSGAAPPIRAG